MKRRFSSLGVVAALVFVGCGGSGDGDGDSAAIANPASAHCNEQGGTVKIITAADGSQSGLCRLADGTEVDEWALYRQTHPSATSTPAPTTAPTASTPAPTTPTTAPTTTRPSDTGTPERSIAYDVFLLAAGSECDRVVASHRTATVEGVLGEAMSELLAGPRPEETAKGLRSWFTPATAGMLRSVIIEDGVARISVASALRTTIPDAASSCGSAGLLAQLDATATQFAAVDKAIYSFDGDVDAFYQWLQRISPT